VAVVATASAIAEQRLEGISNVEGGCACCCGMTLECGGLEDEEDEWLRAS
jgi:hypothetical protein